MNTPAHLIFGMTAFGKAGRPGVTTAALAGSLIPDLSLYLMAGAHLAILGTPPDVVFGELYFSDRWQAIFRIDNSILLWGVVLVLALMARAPIAIALCGGALLHLGLDLPFHHDDGRAHFWPVTNWIFESPLSYWDPAHHGRLIGGIEVAAVLACAVVLWRRFTGWGWRAFVGLCVGLEILPFIAWALMFG